MNAELIFSIVNLIAAIGWSLMILFPRWILTQRVIVNGTLTLILAVVYSLLIIIFFGNTEGGFGSLAAVHALFQNSYLLLAGWIHYLAFDLFIGAWQLRDAQKHQIPHYQLIPVLILTFLFGPVGLLLYFGLRAVRSYRAGITVQK